MKVSVKDGKNCQKILKIEVGQDRITREYEEIFTAMAPQAKIPGFRPGKAPRHIVAMHYRNEAREQVLKNLLNDSYREALQEHSLEPLGYPDVDDVQFNEDKLSFQATIEVRPKIKLSKIKGLDVQKKSVQVNDAEIQDRLQQIRESLAQYKAVEDRASQMGDFLIADYVCTVDGKEVEKRADDWFELRKEDFLKGFSDQLLGLKAGDEKEVRVTFPEDFGRKEFAGREALFQVKVKEIKSKALPELNDEMAKETGDCGSLAELKEKITKQLEEEKNREIEAAYEKELLEELVKKNKIDLPPKLVERRIEYMIEQAKANVLRRGTSEQEFDAQAEKMREGFRPEAEKQIHIAFLLDEIAQKEGIEVADEDVKKKFEALAARFRQPVEEIEKYYRGHHEALDSLRDQIRNEKTIEFIKTNAKEK